MPSIPISKAKAIVLDLVPSVTLECVREEGTSPLFSRHELTLSDGSQLILYTDRSFSVRLLRHEITPLTSEAMLIQHFAAQTRGSGATGATRGTGVDVPTDMPIPVLLKHCPTSLLMGCAYSIFRPQVGEPLSVISKDVSKPMRHQLDKSVDALFRRLATITSPNGKFGNVLAILPDIFEQRIRPTARDTHAAWERWSQAYTEMVEFALRDAEDMGIVLPYDEMRDDCQRLGRHLDAVTTARLVMFDARSEDNVLVTLESDASTDTESGSWKAAAATRKITLNGLRSWSRGIFGDPLLGDICDLSRAVISAGDSTNESESTKQTHIKDEGSSKGNRQDSTIQQASKIDESDKHAHIRHMLYRCYREVLSIATEYQRPRAESSHQELEARKRLKRLLTELAKVY